MNFLKNVWPFDKVKTQYGVLIILEVVLAALAWYLIWDLGFKWLFLALTVFLAQFTVNINNAIVGWLNRPKQKKELSKEEIRKKEAKKKSHHHHRHKKTS